MHNQPLQDVANNTPPTQGGIRTTRPITHSETTTTTLTRETPPAQYKKVSQEDLRNTEPCWSVLSNYSATSLSKSENTIVSIFSTPKR